jgi:hypothetical protein
MILRMPSALRAIIVPPWTSSIGGGAVRLGPCRSDPAAVLAENGGVLNVAFCDKPAVINFLIVSQCSHELD